MSSKSTRKILLVLPGDEDLTTVIDEDKVPFKMERWSVQRDYVIGPSGRKYKFDIFVDDSGVIKGDKLNLCATLSADPFGEVNCSLIYGSAVLISRDKDYPNYSLDDWKEICNGVWYDDDLVEKNVGVEFRTEWY